MLARQFADLLGYHVEAIMLYQVRSEHKYLWYEAKCREMKDSLRKMVEHIWCIQFLDAIQH